MICCAVAIQRTSSTNLNSDHAHLSFREPLPRLPCRSPRFSPECVILILHNTVRLTQSCMRKRVCRFRVLQPCIENVTRFIIILTRCCSIDIYNGGPTLLTQVKFSCYRCCIAINHNAILPRCAIQISRLKYSLQVRAILQRYHN